MFLSYLIDMSIIKVLTAKKFQGSSSEGKEEEPSKSDSKVKFRKWPQKYTYHCHCRTKKKKWKFDQKLKKSISRGVAHFFYPCVSKTAYSVKKISTEFQKEEINIWIIKIWSTSFINSIDPIFLLLAPCFQRELDKSLHKLRKIC